LGAERDLYVLTPVTLGMTGRSALRGAFAVVCGHRWLVASILAVCLIAGVAYSILSPRVYRVEVTLAPANPQGGGSGLSAVTGQFGTLAALAGISGLGGSSTQEAVAVLESRAFTAEFIRERQLLPVLFPTDWDPEAGKWNLPEAEVPTVGDGVRLFEDAIRSVSTDLDTGLVTLSLEWTDPVMVADWANSLVSRLNSVLREREMKDATKSLEYLGQQIAKSEVVEVRSALFALVEEQEKRRMLASVNEQYAFRVLDPAEPPEADDPIRPRPMVVMLMAAIMGMFFGVVAAILLDLTRIPPDRLDRVE
jgi:uncharacterized protein involved in exopolysaccharide biosynthesis